MLFLAPHYRRISLRFESFLSQHWVLFLAPHYRRISLRFESFVSQHWVLFLAPHYRRIYIRLEMFLSQHRGFIDVFTSLIFQVKLRYESVANVPLATTLQIDIYTLGILVLQVGLYIQSVYVCMCICMLVCMYECTMYVFMYVFMYVSICMYTHINTIYTHSNTYTHTYPPTHTHIKTHTHTHQHAFFTLIHMFIFLECRRFTMGDKQSWKWFPKQQSRS